MRWGFLGASRIGRRALAPAIRAAGHTLHSVAARDQSRADAFAAEFAFARAYDSYQALVEDPTIDAVYNALPNDAHLPWTIRALDAGKHVLCEKPLALTEAEVATMQQAEQRNHRVVLEAFCHLHHPQLARLQALLAAGAIGKLVALQAMFGNRMTDPNDFRWHAQMGGGALFDLGCYCVSLLRSLAGEPESVSAMQTLHGDVDESFSGQLDFAGIAGQFTCSFAAPFTQHLTLLGTAGRIDLDWPISTKGRETTLTLGTGIERFAAGDPYVTMVEHFAGLAAGRDLPYGLAWSRAQARALDALFAAARTRSVVKLPR